MNLLAQKLLISVVHHTCLLSTGVKSLLNFWVVEFRFQRLIHTISLGGTSKPLKGPHWEPVLWSCASTSLWNINCLGRGQHKGTECFCVEMLSWHSRTFFFFVIIPLLSTGLFLPYWGWDLRLTRPKLHSYFRKYVKPNQIISSFQGFHINSL